MSIIPKLTIAKSRTAKAQLNYEGKLCNAYGPLQNLVHEDTSLLGDFTTPKLDFDLEHPVDMIVQNSYDGSVNLIINDGKNIPRLINSRFSVQDENKFIIPDHKGYKDTNIYSEDTFNIDSALKPIPTGIPKICFDGVYENQGDLKCGAYTFYFKLSDADGNESEVLAESGVVQLHIGTPNNAQESRMGLEDENSKKSVQFTISNIDSGFDYMHVLFARSSSGQDSAMSSTYHKIVFNYPIKQGVCIVNITGKENIEAVDVKDLFVDYADIQSVKTQTEAANVLLLGNISAPHHDYDALQRIAWKIIPSYEYNYSAVGHVDTDYKDSSAEEDNKLCYYNIKNVYYRLGYWPDEIYRFGIVYIFNDNSLSPVFNIQGVDFSKVPKDIKYEEYVKNFFQYQDVEWECETDDYYFNKQGTINNSLQDISDWKLNSKGVVKFPKTNPTIEIGAEGVMIPSPISIKFDLSYVNKSKYSDYNNEDIFKKHNIKGFFFVRQKRIPTILGQGISIGVTNKDFGNIPVIQNNTGQYVAESFLQSSRLLNYNGSNVAIPKDNVSVRGLLVPEAELCTGVYNDIFVGNDYCLQKVGNYSFKIDSNSEWYRVRFNRFQDDSDDQYVSSLLNIPEDISILTNGEDYFSTIAGNASEAYKTIDVNKAWNNTVPQDLTVSTSLVRGQFGAFVGVGSPTHDGVFPFNYGDVYNIKDKRYAEDEETATRLDFQKRFNDFSEYKAICDRTEIVKEINCFRGDCFQSMFTHRMNRNFIDPELPTNTQIVDPACWSANYAVRCTAPILTDTHSNLTDDSDGWEIPSPQNQPWIQALIYFLTGNIIGGILKLINGYAGPAITPEKLGLSADYVYDKEEEKYYKIKYQKDDNGNYIINTNYNPDDENEENKYYYVIDTNDPKEWFDPNNIEDMYPNGFANEIVQAFEVYKGTDPMGAAIRTDQRKKKVNPSQQESSGAFDLKAIFKADDDWDLRGLASINRADVNAVGLGQWITFPILASRNLAFRDLDYSNSIEQASFNRKRGFFPLNKMHKQTPLRDSNVINAAASINTPHKPYFSISDYRFLKQEYFTRVFNSLTDSASTFTNQYKQVLESSHQDYTKRCGSITKLVTVGNIIYVIFEHGIGQVTFQPTQAGFSPEMMQDVILLTDNYGSIWKDSIILANNVVYGVDSVAKKIWCISGKEFKIISDFKVQKFLIDNLDMSEFTTTPYLGHVNIKTHFNAYKNDVIFTYYNDTPIYNDNNEIVSWEKGTTWSLCYNQPTDKFITFYDWYPVESVNIDNIYFSFDKDRFTELLDSKSEQKINRIFLEERESYIIKKFNIDERFNHNVTVYTIKDSVTFKVIDKKVQLQDFILSFYCKGDVTILNETHTYDKWQHVTVYIKNVNSDTLFTLKGNFDITEIFSISSKYFPDIEKYATARPEKSFIYDESGLDPVTIYNLRNTQNQMYLWKHGQAGIYDIQGQIKPTNWYNKQHEFNFEFIVNDNSSQQKIFDNLKIISNKTAPYKFEYEVVGEGYEWFEYKPIIKWINNNSKDVDTLKDLYKEVLSTPYNELLKKYQSLPTLFNPPYMIQKLPYIDLHSAQDSQVTTITQDNEYKHNSSKTTLVYDKRQNDYNVHTEQYGNDIKKFGRMKGNMQYLEDLWDIEIRPIAFTYVYVKDGVLTFQEQKETRHRDKYIKIKVRYSGEDLAVIQAVSTIYNQSYA